MHLARGLALVTGLLLASAFAVQTAGAFGDLDRPKDLMLACYMKKFERTQTKWVETPPIYQSMIEHVVADPASSPSGRKRRHVLDREETMCKVEMPDSMCPIPVRDQADTGEHVLTRFGSIRGVNVSGC